MRINKFVAQATGMSRRGADTLVARGKVLVNNRPALIGQEVTHNDSITIDGKKLQLLNHQTIMLHKPVGYVCSRDGQGSKTIYDLIPSTYHHLKPVGRLDKDSSGLLLLTNDGELANTLTHPSYNKEKHYTVILNKSLSTHDQAAIEEGVMLDDGISKFTIKGQGTNWNISMQEGRNRQIRRTFQALGYKVMELHRLQFGEYSLADLKAGSYKTI